MLIRELKRHFPARTPEWWNAGTMFAWGSYLLLHPGILNQPYTAELLAMCRAWSPQAPERFLGLMTITVAMVRACALIVNGSYRRTPSIRLVTSAISAFLWSQIVIGIMHSGLPAFGIVMYSSALLLDLVSAYRSAIDMVLAKATWREQQGVAQRVHGGGASPLATS